MNMRRSSGLLATFLVAALPTFAAQAQGRPATPPAKAAPTAGPAKAAPAPGAPAAPPTAAPSVPPPVEPAPVVAAPQAKPPGDARALFEAGQSSYKIGDFKAAIQAFEQAYVIDPRPALLFSIGQAHRRQYAIDNRAGHVAVAIKSFKDYLAKVETGGRRADAALALNELQPLALTLEIEGKLQPLEPEEPETRLVISSPSQGAEVLLDGGTERKPLPLAVVLTPGRHSIVISSPGYVEEKREIEVARGAVTALDSPLEPLKASVAVDGPSGAEVTVDGRSLGSLPLAAPLQLEAGPRRIRVALSGHESYLETLELGRGESASISAGLEWTGQRKLAVGLLIGGGALFAGGAATGAIAIVNHLEASSIRADMDAGQVVCRTGSCEPLSDYNASLATRDSLTVASSVLFGASVLSLGGGLLLYSLDGPSPERPVPPDAAPAPAAPASLEVSAGLGGARLTATF